MKILPAVKIKEDGSDEKKLWNKEGFSCIQYDKERVFIGEKAIFHHMTRQYGSGCGWSALKNEIGEKTF